MNRILQQVCVQLALVLSILSASCATLPPARTIPPEVILKVEQDRRLWKDRWVANDLINRAHKTYGTPDAHISDFFRNDVLAQIEPLRHALQSNDAVEISQARASLEDRMELLGHTRSRIEQSMEFLSKVGGGLSPSLKAEVKNAMLSAQRSLQGDSWDEVRAEGGHLGWMDAHWIIYVRSFQESDSYLSQLGDKLNPKLTHQYDVAVKPMRQALKGNSWDEIAKQWGQLPKLAYYPRDIVYATLGGRSMLEMLPPSGRQDILSALAAVDDALQGESWDQALVQAEQIETAIKVVARKFGGELGIPPAPCVSVLSIDGGGVRGIIAATILAELERRTNKPIAKLFDVIVGTSTGGIMALGLAKPNPQIPGEPLYKAADFVRLYENEGNKIFPESPLNGIRGFFGPKYRPEGLEQVLKAYLGEDTLLGEALTNVVIPAYALEERKHVFFSTYGDEGFYIYMWEAARATSAAPTYFPPFRVPVFRRPYAPQSLSKSHITLIDGGVFANNPAPYALSIAKKLIYEEPVSPDAPKIPYDYQHPLLLLSLGTGQVPRSTSFEDAWNWGLLGWARPVIDIVFSDPGIEDETRQLMAFSDFYFRLQPQTLTDSTATLDNASSDNIQQLKKIAKEYVSSDEVQSQLDKLVALLLRERPKDCQRAIVSTVGRM